MTGEQHPKAHTALDEEDFSDIAPYPESELVERLLALAKQKVVLDAVGSFQFPASYQLLSPAYRLLLRFSLAKRIRSIQSRKEWHVMLAEYVKHCVDSTTDGFAFSGLEKLPQDQACLFVSNHRDITLDPILVNYALWQNDMPTTQIAIGDNLLEIPLEAEFMRINDSFIVIRNAKGLKAQYVAMTKTSRYIRRTLEKGQSIWIAQREGRAKDGLDQTDPAVLKMFALAFRDESKDLSYMLERINLVPVTFTYELDPCAPRKAIEVAEREKTGSYQKSEHEDRDSLIEGIRGYKGRVHLAFGAPITGDIQSPEELARIIDSTMDSHRKPFDVFHLARARQRGQQDPVVPQNRVKATFEAQVASVAGRERELLIEQYANQLA